MVISAGFLIRVSGLSGIARRLAVFPAVALLAFPGGVTHSDEGVAAAGLTALELSNSPLELQSLVMDMADSYTAALGEVVYLDLRQDELDPKSRWLAISFLRNGMGAALDIGVSANPGVGLLDMLVLSSLQVWAFEKRWLNVAGIGPAGERAAERLRLAEAELWQEGARVLSEAQIGSLRQLVENWKEAHPDRMVVSLVRFDEFTKARRLSTASRESATGLLASVKNTGAAIEDVKLLGERVLWFAGRYPYLLGQQAELTAYRLADQPEATIVRDSLAALNERLGSLDDDLSAQQEELFRRLASERESAIEDLFRGLAVERSAMFDELEQRQKDVLPVMSELLEIIRASDALTSDLTKTFEALDRIVARFDRDPDDTREPLDIKDLTAAATETAVAAEKLTLLLERATVSLDSPNWDTRLDRVDSLTTQMVDRAFWRLLMLIGAVFLGLALLRLVPLRARQPGNAGSP